MTSARTRGRRPRTAGARRFVATENTGALALVVATVTALVWANSPWGGTYEALWTAEISVHVGGRGLALQTREWVNEGLMALFFFVAGLEVRRELDMGELRERRRVAPVVLAALGGMIVPILLYLALNVGEPSARGWGIVMGTDTAFALGVLTLVRGASPPVRSFLLTLVIIDDVVALTVIGVAYTNDLSVPWLLVAVALFGVVLALRALKVRHGAPYLVAGVAVWAATLASGVEATVAGVALGVVFTAYPPRRAGLYRAGTVWRRFRMNPSPALARRAGRAMVRSVSPNERFQHLFHPWASYLVVPLFALANAGIRLDSDTLARAATSPITIGIVAGLVVGKLVGITASTWLVTRRWGGALPLPLPWPSLIGVSSVAGIGFTVSLLIADITFTGTDLEDAKAGVLAASGLAALLAWAAFWIIQRLPRPLRSAGASRLAPPLSDVAEPIDPEVDHLQGDPDAPVTLLWYGDFECDHCAAVRPVVDRLRHTFAEHLTVVFRHLPLPDIHPHAQLAAEAAEVAAVHGKFWDMHAILFDHHDALTPRDLARYAAVLGIDRQEFAAALEERRHALRIERDVASADDSGAAGTPTFFINGRRYVGGHDHDDLAAGIRRAHQLSTR
ncbi:sodium:proton antiporter [Actinotalea ferrariae CF5-4]|uniref:Na(+)/H(+) antiporter NhaA n=1 Tax=Actinotalea ferrariae CF5-4 TaxID=948458 RepID=A0A021VWV0_9CELL|nr:sodium:proton antiporter [Actinotalea ferrariae CF5-4]